MQRSHFRGHKIIWTDGRWVYADTGAPTAEAWLERPCGYCGMPATDAGHDGCIGEVPGVMNACCGHGVESDAYVQFLDGSTVCGKRALDQMTRWG